MIMSACKPVTIISLPEAGSYVVRKGATVVSSKIKVELDIFSGNPNPTWFLSDCEGATFINKLLKLPKIPARELFSKLGYRGFIVQVTNDSEQSLIKLQNGMVQFSKGDSNVYYGDVCLDLERWLLNSGKLYLKSDLFDMVKRELQNAEKTDMNGQGDTPLTNVPGWRKDYIDKLAESWITNAEQVVGMAVTPDGIQTLAKQLKVSAEEMHRLIDLARTSLPPLVARELEMEVDTSQYGLGALPPATPQKPRCR
jgi:hypothetical protein